MRPALFASLCTAALVAGLPAGLLPPADHRPEVPAPDLGARYTPHHALLAYVRALAAAAPDRVQLRTLNTTEEGREQPFLVITSPANLKRLEEWKALNGKLAEPRTCPEDEARRIAETSPVFVWLGYSVHGSEVSGSEAALAVAYHFAASRSSRGAEAAGPGGDPHGPHPEPGRPGPPPPGRRRGPPRPSTPTIRRMPRTRPLAQWPVHHQLFDLNRDWAWQTQGGPAPRPPRFSSGTAGGHGLPRDVDGDQLLLPPTMRPIHEPCPKPTPGAGRRPSARAWPRPSTPGAGPTSAATCSTSSTRATGTLAHLPGRRGHDLRSGRSGRLGLPAHGWRDPHPGEPDPAACRGQPRHRGHRRGRAPAPPAGFPAGPARAGGPGRPGRRLPLRRRGIPPGRASWPSSWRGTASSAAHRRRAGHFRPGTHRPGPVRRPAPGQLPGAPGSAERRPGPGPARRRGPHGPQAHLRHHGLEPAHRLPCARLARQDQAEGRHRHTP
ncbi:MAG: hypothetical protein IPO28_13525 [Holophagaceae bacterium]|nr:hypothetical protein [Holophagaceae bacterium]